jgi:hypothetical protein
MAQQEWTISISSAGTGAVDEQDDGRNLRLQVFDKDETLLLDAQTDPADSQNPWKAPNIDQKRKSWSRKGACRNAGCGAR